MTVSYNDNFFKLLFRWKASIWKGILPSLGGYMLLYYVIYLPLYFGLDYNQKARFQVVRAYFESNLKYFPLTFLLGFFVAQAVGRWWQQFQKIGYPDRFMYMLIGFAPQCDAETVEIRQNIARWLNLQAILYYNLFSKRVFKRFPTMDSIVEIGFMTPSEKKTYDALSGPFGKTSIVHVWIQKAINDLKERGQLNDVQQIKLYDELANYRGSVASLLSYDKAPMPLVYTQVVTLATWGYFMMAMIANMRMHTTEAQRGNLEYDIYFPIFLVLQFIFYMGWLKVAQDLFNPFGEDDDDFEMHYLIDRLFDYFLNTILIITQFRNASVSELIATEMCASWPRYSKEQFVDPSKRIPLRYPKVALKKPGHLYDGNLEHIIVTAKDRVLLDLKQTEERLKLHDQKDKNIRNVIGNSIFKRNRNDRPTPKSKEELELMAEMEKNNHDEDKA